MRPDDPRREHLSRILHLLMELLPSVWMGRSVQREPFSWTVTVGRGIRRYRDVESVDDLVGRTLAASKPNPAPGPAASPSPEPAVAAQSVDPDTEGFDVALSFAGEEREYVERVAERLRAIGISVFYDAYEAVGLWGRNLVDRFADVYGRSARYVVMFISASYAEKAWTSEERRHAQASALETRRESILPVRFDETPVPGLPSTVGYVRASDYEPAELADLIAERIREPGDGRGEAPVRVPRSPAPPSLAGPPRSRPPARLRSQAPAQRTARSGSKDTASRPLLAWRPPGSRTTSRSQPGSRQAYPRRARDFSPKPCRHPTSHIRLADRRLHPPLRPAADRRRHRRRSSDPRQQHVRLLGSVANRRLLPQINPRGRRPGGSRQALLQHPSRAGCGDGALPCRPLPQARGARGCDCPRGSRTRRVHASHLTAAGTRRIFFTDRRAVEDLVTTNAQFALSNVEPDLRDIVKELLAPLFILFDYFELADEVYEDLITRFRAGEVS